MLVASSRLLLPRLSATPAVARIPRRFYESEYHQHSTRYYKTDRAKLKSLEQMEFPHHEPVTLSDKFSFNLVRVLRVASDLYFKDRLVHRACMLETVAAIPPFVSGMVHHLRSLRTLRHCQWIKPELDEAENERMHLMTFMELLQPTRAQHLLIIATQAVLMTMYFPFYLLASKTAHRFVGYLEQEACKTYTHFLELIDEGKIENVPAPDIAIRYWGLPTDATLRDVVLVVRADEADHRLVNHYMADAYKHMPRDAEDKNPCRAFVPDLESPVQTEPQQKFAAGYPPNEAAKHAVPPSKEK